MVADPDLEAMVVAAVARNSVAGGGAAIPREGNLFNLGILDSMSVVALAADLEAALHRQIPTAEFVPENFSSVTGIVSLCSRLQGAPAGPGGAR